MSGRKLWITNDKVVVRTVSRSGSHIYVMGSFCSVAGVIGWTSFKNGKELKAIDDPSRLQWACYLMVTLRCFFTWLVVCVVKVGLLDSLAKAQ